MSSSTAGPHTAAPVADRNWGRSTFVLGAIATSAALAYFGFVAEVRDPIHLPIGLGILLLAVLPALLWARRGKASLPIFEVMLLTTGNTYALPLLNGHEGLIHFVPEDITAAGLAILVFQAVAITTHGLVSGRPRQSRFWREDAMSGRISGLLMYGMALNTAYIVISSYTDLIPYAMTGVLRAVFFGIGIISVFITSRRIGTAEATAGERTFFVANLVLQILALLTSLFLVSVVSLLLLALVGYVSGSGRVPVLAAGAALLGVAILHNGKDDMRQLYWADVRTRPTLEELPSFFTTWVTHGLNVSEEEDAPVAAKLIDRTSLFHMMCLVVSASPHQQPFLHGETYADIPAQFVPRFLWPEKPPGHVSTSKLSVYYGLQTEDETEKTTIGFGMLTEAYANFGFYGVAALGVFLGLLIKKVQVWGSHSPLFSYGGIILVILLAWSFQTEFTVSMWLSSLYQACIAALACPFFLRRLFG